LDDWAFHLVLFWWLFVFAFWHLGSGWLFGGRSRAPLDHGKFVGWARAGGNELTG
jgi:hypothetical protein